MEKRDLTYQIKICQNLSTQGKANRIKFLIFHALNIDPYLKASSNNTMMKTFGTTVLRMDRVAEHTSKEVIGQLIVGLVYLVPGIHRVLFMRFRRLIDAARKKWHFHWHNVFGISLCIAL